jgi:DNA-binding NarL/FixJ family response regulator
LKKPTQQDHQGGHETLSRTADMQDDPVERVVLQLNALCKATTLNFALAVGGLIIRQFFGGDLRYWRSREQKHELSLRRLARHPHLPMSVSALYRSIAIYELCERLDIKSYRHVSTSHIRLVLPLPAEEQTRLLQLTESNRWTVRRLDEEAQAIRSRYPSSSDHARGGRNHHSPLRAALHLVRRCVDAVVSLASDETSEGEYSPEQVRDAVELLREAARACALLETRLSRAMPAGASSSMRTRTELSSLAPYSGNDRSLGAPTEVEQRDTVSVVPTMADVGIDSTNSPRVDTSLLTTRECEVVSQALRGHCNKLIAYDLGLAQPTVRVLLARAATKLGVHSRKELLEKVRTLTRSPR